MKMITALMFAALAAVFAVPVSFAQVAWSPMPGSNSNDYIVREVTLSSTSLVSAVLRLDPRSLVGLNFVNGIGSNPSLTLITSQAVNPLATNAISVTTGPILVNSPSQTNLLNPVTGLQVRMTGASSETLRVQVYELDSVRNRGYR
jgi:hypothetical protein